MYLVRLTDVGTVTSINGEQSGDLRSLIIDGESKITESSVVPAGVDSSVVVSIFGRSAKNLCKLRDAGFMFADFHLDDATHFQWYNASTGNLIPGLVANTPENFNPPNIPQQQSIL